MKFTRKVLFSETDASGRAHFTSLLKWAEDAEHQALLKLGVPVFENGQGWPRVHVSCDYKNPVRFGDEISVELSLKKLGNSSLTWAFQIVVPDEGQVAEGQMTTVFCSSEGKATPLEESWTQALSVAFPQ